MGIHDGHREQVRQRFLQEGLDAFADHEALELLLYYAIPRRDTNALAHALIDRYGSLEAVLTAPMEDLKRFPGLGERSAVLLNLIPQLYRKACLSNAKQEVVLSSVEEVGTYLLNHLAGERREVLYQLCLDAKGKVLACKKLGRGSAVSVPIDLRVVVENALYTGASAVILAHNHPSGQLEASSDDLLVTQRVMEALGSVGVRLVDHFIVGNRQYVSLATAGLL